MPKNIVQMNDEIEHFFNTTDTVKITVRMYKLMTNTIVLLIPNLFKPVQHDFLIIMTAIMGG